MKKILFLLLAALPLALAAQDKVINDPNAQARQVGPFHAIKVSTGIQLIIKQGATDAVAVSASDKEARDHIKTEVVNGVLKIYFNTDFWSEIKTFKYRKLKAYVSFKDIDAFSGSSGSNTTVDGSISAGNLAIDLSSGAYFKGDIKATNLSVSQGSGSHGDMSGQAQALTVKTHSGARFFPAMALPRVNAMPMPTAVERLRLPSTRNWWRKPAAAAAFSIKASALLRAYLPAAAAG